MHDKNQNKNVDHLSEITDILGGTACYNIKGNIDVY